MATFQKKLQISAGASFLFLIINLPQTYNLTNKLLPWRTTQNGCPTHLGLLTHTLVFFIITFLTMGNAKVKTGIKLKHSLYGTLIFLCYPIQQHIRLFLDYLETNLQIMDVLHSKGYYYTLLFIVRSW